ncbi:MAG: LPXTG cell wall anchor domain-containing protein [Clostridiales bacterium]|nr:LPXTG cell wall anchor domain-containing protein [Clostridiales bacterium]
MSGKMKMILVVACLLVLALVPSFALAGSNEAVVNGTSYTNFMDAVKAASGTSYPVEIYGTMTVSGSFPNNVNVKIVGKTDDAALNLGSSAHAAHGGIMVFEDLKLIKANVNYAGFHHAAKVTYNDCTIEGEYWTYAPETEFNRCTFIQTAAGNYNLWTYGATNCTLNDCTFKFASKSVLFYNESKTNNFTLNVNNCKFITENYVASDKAAIEIDSSLSTTGSYTLNLSGNEVDCLLDPNGENGMWRHKKGEKLTVSESGSSQIHNDECGHVVEEPEEEEEEEVLPPANQPVTGDSMPLMAAFAAMLLSLGAILVLSKRQRKSEN